MRTVMTGGLLAALVGTALSVSNPLPATAQLARPQTAIAIAGDNDLLTDVQWRRGWRGRGWYGPGVGLGLGLATGALIGGAIAGPRYYYDGPAYYDVPEYDEAPVTYYGAPQVYAAPPVYEAPQPYYRAPQPSYGAPADGGAVQYCMQRFKSYDPSSGTYLGYDGQRHSCP